MTSRPWSAEECSGVLTTVTGPGPVLRALQAVQEHFGFVPDESVPVIAEHFNVSRADVFGVLTFYSDLRRTAPAAVEVAVCMGEACQSVGARDLLAAADAHSSADCNVRRVYCVGNCAVGPSAVVNGRILGRVSDVVLAGAIADVAGGVQS